MVIDLNAATGSLGGAPSDLVRRCIFAFVSISAARFSDRCHLILLFMAQFFSQEFVGQVSNRAGEEADYGIVRFCDRTPRRGTSRILTARRGSAVSRKRKLADQSGTLFVSNGRNPFVSTWIPDAASNVPSVAKLFVRSSIHISRSNGFYFITSQENRLEGAAADILLDVVSCGQFSESDCFSRVWL